MSGDVLHLACGSSPEYLPHAAASISSFIARCGELAVSVHYLHGPATAPTDLAALREMADGAGASLETLLVDDERIAALHPVEFAPATIWYRVFLPEMLPSVDKVLYVDVDTLAVDAVEPLWTLPLGDYLVAGVSNVWEPWNSGYPAALGLADPGAYFNSGVLVMDLAGMRAEGIGPRLVEFATGRTDLAWGDQDALNVVLAGRWLHLHPRWNCMNSVLGMPAATALFGADIVAEAQANPGIRHFEGPYQNKPWHLLCDRATRELYARQRRVTPWPRVVPEGRTPRNYARLLRRQGPRGLLRP